MFVGLLLLQLLLIRFDGRFTIQNSNLRVADMFRKNRRELVSDLEGELASVAKD